MTRQRIITLAAALLLALAGVACAVMADQLARARTEIQDLQTQLQHACAGTIATLDLTDWVQVCRTVHIEDLDR